MVTYVWVVHECGDQECMRDVVHDTAAGGTYQDTLGVFSDEALAWFEVWCRQDEIYDETAAELKACVDAGQGGYPIPVIENLEDRFDPAHQLAVFGVWWVVEKHVVDVGPERRRSSRRETIGTFEDRCPCPMHEKTPERVGGDRRKAEST